ncbi:MAG: S9 family peptidase [Acidobacteria bacterium]|nr:S9 family peptidase [Acidobacteriota bacterium]
MRTVITLFALAVLCGVVAVAAAAQPPVVPLRDFFKNPQAALFKISPSGKYLACLKPYQNRLNIFVQEVGGKESARLTGVTDRDIPFFGWKTDNLLIFVKDSGGDENFHLFSVGRDGKETRDLTPFPGVKANVIDPLFYDDDAVIVGLNKRNPALFDAYRLDLRTGELALLAENPGNITGWTADHAGVIRAATATDGVNTTLLYRETEGDPFKPVVTTTFKETLQPLFFTFDNRNLYALSNLGRDRTAVVIFDPRTGKESDLLFAHPFVDVSGLTWSRKRKVLTGVEFTDWKQQWVPLDEEYAQVYEELRRRLPEGEIDLASVSRSEDMVTLALSSDRNPGHYYLFDRTTGKLEDLGSSTPWLKETEMAAMKPVRFTARDGLTLHGYLTLPVGRDPKNLPVVLNPHGGPWHRDEWGFNPEIQFLANRGYAVLQVNFRGSTGYGRKFWEASFKQWGKAMQDDLTDGVKWLVSQGIADPKRVAIYGGSYGGYATLAGLTFTPELYACGVDYVGVSNLFTFMKTIPPYWKPYLEMMYEMVGHPEKDKDLLTSASPVFHVDRIKVPLLVAQGAKDPRVNIDESNQIVEALKKRGVTVEYLVKDNEGHGFHNEENRFAFYEAMEAFLAKHLGAR